MTIIETMARAMNPPQTIGLAGGARSRELTFDDLDESAKKESRDQARAALRAVKPEDVSDTMLGAFGAEVARPGMGNESPAEMYRRAIAAAIAAGAEQ